MAQSASTPFTKWSDTDHSGPILIATTLCMLYWIIAGVMQHFLSLARGMRYSWTDYTLTAAMIVAFVQSILILVACHNGLGRSASSVHRLDLGEAQQAYHVSNVLYAVSLGLIKCSAALFVANLTVKNMSSLRLVPIAQKWSLAINIALIVVWMLGSAVALGLPCTSATTGVCMGTVDRWVGVFIGDAITDLIISAFAASVILRTKARLSKRLLWYLPFVVRVSVPLIAGFRLLTISTHALTHDPTIALWLFITLTQVQIMIALISAAISALKHTLLELTTYYGAMNDSQSGDRMRGGSYPLKCIQRNQITAQGDHSEHMCSRGLHLSAQVDGNPRAGRSKAYVRSGRDTDGESQDEIIRQEDYEVRFDIGESSDRDISSGDCRAPYR